MKDEKVYGIQAYRDENIVALVPGPDKKIYQTGLKVLKNLSETCFLPAYTAALNGRTQLVYDIHGLDSMSVLLPQIGPEAFLKIVESLSEANRQIRENGFIKGENILLDRDNLFVSAATMQVRLLYLPLQGEFESTAQLNSMELRLRTLLMEILDSCPNLLDSRTAALRTFLSSPSNQLENFFQYLKQAKAPAPPPEEKPVPVPAPERPASDSLYLVRMGGKTRFALRIKPQGTIIGRDLSKADCVIQDGSVSGQHCRLYRQGSRWMVEDLGSTNGTRLNERQLSAYQPTPIQQGDTLSLSRFVLKVSEEE